MEIAINAHAAATDVAEETVWFKSSYSNDSGGSCVEIANLTGQVGIRDSKVEQGPALVVTKSAWSALVGFVQSSTTDIA